MSLPLRRIVLVLGLWPAACAPSSEIESVPMSTTPVDAVAVVDPSATAGGAREVQDGVIDPSILLPSPDSRDDVVARVGDVEIRKRHLYEHLLLTEPAVPRRLVEIMRLDALVARAAERWNITLEASQVYEKAAEQEAELRGEVERQLGTRLSFEQYLERQFGMSSAEYGEWLRTNLTRETYRQFVMRFAALREDRVEVRYIVNADRGVLEEVAGKVRQGASFATLAIRHTEDDNRMDGGLLPPFGAAFDHPVADVGFGLAVGELSDIFMRESQGGERYYLVYCLRRIPGRDVEFELVQDELRREIDNRPLTEMEFRAASIALETAMESHDSDSPGR